MRINHIEAIPIGLPLAKPLIMGGRRYERSESLLVHVSCSNGAEGWGEAAPHAARGEHLTTLVAEVRDTMAPHLHGASLADRSLIVARLRQEARCSPRAIAAIEIALADAFARAQDLRVADLYGGARRQSLAQKWLIGSARLDDDLAEAGTRLADGLFLFMLKVGSRPLEQDVLLARQLRHKFGSRIQLCADANGAWDRSRAISYLTQVRDIGLLYLEQPLPAGELRDAAAVASAVATPLSLDEGIGGVTDILAAWRAGATSGAIIKPSKYGGLTAAQEAGILCHALNIKVGLATPMAESSIGTAAALQVAAVLPQVAWDIGPSSDYLAEDVVEVPIRHTAGHLHVATGHGLGVDVSRRQVERFRLDH